MLVTKLLITAIDIHIMEINSMEVNGYSQLIGYHILQNISFFLCSTVEINSYRCENLRVIK